MRRGGRGGEKTNVSFSFDPSAAAAAAAAAAAQDSEVCSAMHCTSLSKSASVCTRARRSCSSNTRGIKYYARQTPRSRREGGEGKKKEEGLFRNSFGRILEEVQKGFSSGYL